MRYELMIWSIPVLLGLLFLYSFLKEKRRFRNAVLLMLLVLSVLAAVALNVRRGAAGFILVALLCFIVLPVAAVVMSVMYIRDGVIAIRKEGLSLPSVLSIAFPIVLWAGIAFIVYVLVFSTNASNLLMFFALFLTMAEALVLFTFFALYLYSLLYRMVPKKVDCNYIIIHGAGLMDDGTLTPLLKGRTDKAMEAWEKGGRNAMLICSGGQGADEVRSEASAMKAYLLEQGVPEDHILMEDKSTTTFENMKYSKELIMKDAAVRFAEKSTDSARVRRRGKPASVLFVTSDYHVFRAGTYARKVGLKADGIGSKTAGYYFPNAFIREYIAIMVNNKKTLLIILGVWVAGILMVLYS